MRHPAPVDSAGAEVVAGMANDGSAAAVAATAVRLARQLGGRVRFIQILPPTLRGDARAAAESAMFTTALRALHGRPQIQATFEAPTSDPAAHLVARSRGALRLVLGEDHPHRRHPDSVTAHCVAHAGCVVHVVPAEHP